ADGRVNEIEERQGSSVAASTPFADGRSVTRMVRPRVVVSSVPPRGFQSLSARSVPRIVVRPAGSATVARVRTSSAGPVSTISKDSRPARRPATVIAKTPASIFVSARAGLSASAWLPPETTAKLTAAVSAAEITAGPAVSTLHPTSLPPALLLSFDLYLGLTVLWLDLVLGHRFVATDGPTIEMSRGGTEAAQSKGTVWNPIARRYRGGAHETPAVCLGTRDLRLRQQPKCSKPSGRRRPVRHDLRLHDIRGGLSDGVQGRLLRLVRLPARRRLPTRIGVCHGQRDELLLSRQRHQDGLQPSPLLGERVRLHVEPSLRRRRREREGLPPTGLGHGDDRRQSRLSSRRTGEPVGARPDFFSSKRLGVYLSSRRISSVPSRSVGHEGLAVIWPGSRLQRRMRRRLRSRKSAGPSGHGGVVVRRITI